MTLTELRYIVAVARERHFGRAAESCFVSQPTLSIAIRKLEEELGIKLFERGSKNEVRLTEIGSAIVEQAQRVLEESEVITQLAQQGKDPLRGSLRLGLIYTIAPYLLPGLIPRLHQAAPEMRLIIEENYTSELAKQLKQGRMEAIVISLPFEEPGIEVRPVYEEPFEVAVPRGHPWERRKRVAPADLANENLLLLGAGHCFRDQVLQACPECNRTIHTGNSLQRTLEGSSLETIRHMVATGVGVTVLPCTSISKSTQNLDLLSILPFKDPAPGRTVAVAWRRKFPRQEAIELLCETIAKCPLDCAAPIRPA
jgi:LysR family hydrogen peroxide-inducible transcriptional activator